MTTQYGQLDGNNAQSREKLQESAGSPGAPGSPKGVTNLLSFVPGVLARQFATDPTPPEKPGADRFRAAVLFADISGFTALAETLARRAAGVDELTRLLNCHFGCLIDTIDAHGGDVIKFAGDALFAVWPSQDEDLSTVTARAAQCALAVQSLFQNAEPSEDLQLSMRIGIGAGPVTVLTLGGLNGRWAMVATGDAMAQVKSPVCQAQPGDVVISPEAWAWVSRQTEGQPLQQGAVRLSSARGAAPVGRSAPLLTLESAPALRAFIPPAVVACLEQGRTDWLGELRRVTVLFIHFPGLTNDTTLERAQSVMLAIQGILNHFEASVNKLSVDEKGVAMVAALGLPPLGHEDDPERGAQAALDIQERLRELNVRHAIGVTTGRAFCGVIGNSTRCEYTIIGGVVNLASRLMQAAAGDILCDQATFEAARDVRQFEELPPISVKGKSSPLAVFRPLASGLKSTDSTLRMEPPIVGRESERTLLRNRLGTLVATGKGGVVLVEGEAGIGKSRLIVDLSEQARTMNIDVVRGQGHSVESSTPYFAWRAVFEDLCEIRGSGDSGASSGTVMRLIGAEWAERASLVNPVLLTDFPETAATAGLTDQARSEQRHELLLRLLETRPQTATSRALILEDGHWMDSASWTLAWLASQRIPSLLLVITTRPMRNLAPDEFQSLASAPGNEFLRLEGLSSEEVIRMVCLRLGTSRLPDQVAAMILDKAEGNPLFSQELAYALRDSGLIRIANGDCQVAPDVGDLSELDIPGTVQAAITSRVDRLAPSQQLLLKVASVIGRVFNLQTLRRIYPIEAERGQLSEMMLGLTERDIFSLDSPDAPDPDVAYTFRHSVLQNVAYGLMLLSQRRQLHRTVAELLENVYAGKLASQYPLLAHHWGKVIEYGDKEPGLVSKVIDYLQKAGEQALRSYANREAVTFLKEALRLLECLPEGPDRDRKELAIQCALGAPVIAIKGFASPETEKVFGRALALCKQLGSAPEQFQVTANLWNFYTVSARFQKAQELAGELQSLAEATHDPSLKLSAETALGETAVWLGRPSIAKEHLAKALELYHPRYHEHEAFRTAQNSAVVSMGFLSWSLWLLGYPDQALGMGREQLSLAKNLSHPFSVAMSLMHFSALCQFRHEPEASRGPLDSVQALAREEGFQLWSANSSILRGWVMCEQGRESEGISQMCRSIEEWRATGAEVCFPYYLSMLAGAYGKVGQPEAGLALVEEALSISETTGEAWWRAELIRLKGLLTLLSPGNNRRAAEICFREAIQIARQQSAKSLELRATVSLGRLLARQGRCGEARQMLAAIYGWFEEGLDTPDLMEANALLQEIGTPDCIPNLAKNDMAGLSSMIV